MARRKKIFYGSAWSRSVSAPFPSSVNIKVHAVFRSKHETIVGRCTAAPPAAGWTALLQTLITSSTAAFVLYGKKKRIPQTKHIIISATIKEIITVEHLYYDFLTIFCDMIKCDMIKCQLIK